MSSDASLADSLRAIERLANRLVDWNGFRIWRLNNGALRMIYSSDEGLLADPRENGMFGARLREFALSTGEPLVIADASRDARAEGVGVSTVSLAVVPLRFGDRAIGVVELDHHKRGTYGAKEVTLVSRFASQLATALHIQKSVPGLWRILSKLAEQAKIHVPYYF